MPTCSQDEPLVNETGPETLIPSPNVIRTRSGRSVGTPAAVQPGVQSLKTTSRRARKSATQKPIEEVPTTNTTSGLESVRPDSVTSSSEPEEANQASGLCNESTLKDDQTGVGNNQVNTVDTHMSIDTHTSNRKRTHSQTCEKGGRMVPLGKPKSGRVWKDRNKQRFSALLRDKPLRSSWQEKMEAKREKEIVKKYSQQLKDDKAREKEEMRKRREENQRRREENERKAEIVQVIRNTAKLKRMKKKQLRKIEKRDTLPALQKTAPAVKKAGKGE